MIPEWFKQIYWYTQYFINKDWIVYRIGGINGAIYRNWRYLKPTENKNRWGYMYVSLQEPLIKRKNCLLHRLVAQTFIPNPENKIQINHIDWNKKNNSISNLEWVSDLENKKHARGNWLYSDKKKVLCIDSEWNETIYNSLTEASKFTKADISSISAICNKNKKRYQAKWYLFKFI